MGQEKKKKRTRQILDILLLLCGGGLVVNLWQMRTQREVFAVILAILVCMVWGLFDLLFFCGRKKEHSRKADSRAAVPETVNGYKLQRLILLDGQEKPVKSWDLQGKTALIIGKAGQNQDLDVDLSDCEYSCFIDFQHAVLNFCLDQWFIEDLESQNGVKIKKVEDGECYRVIHRPCRVMAGDVLYIANTKLLLT